MYTNGDICNVESQLTFNSEIRYICDPNIEVGKPVLIKQIGQSGKFSTENDCRSVFEWRSSMACPYCRVD